MTDPAPLRPWLRIAIRAAVHRPVAMLSAWAVLVLVSSFGVARIDFDTSAASVLDRTDPSWQFYRDSVERFGGDEVVVVAVKGRYAYDPETLAEVVRLSEYARNLPSVRRVDSLATVPFIHSNTSGDLILAAPMASGAPADDRAAAAVKSLVSKDRLALGNLVSRDGRVFAINIQLDAESADAQRALVDKIESIVDPERTWVSGVPVFRTHVSERTRRDILLFVPLVVMIIATLLLIAFRTINAPLVSLLCSGAGTVVTLGVMGGVGTPIVISTMILPSILLALGSAYVMHILAVARGVTEPSRLEHEIGGVAMPILFSGVTTVIGFLALSSIRIDVIREFGGYGALGVMMVLCATLTLAPAALQIFPLVRGSGPFNQAMEGRLRSWIMKVVVDRRNTVLCAWGVLVVVFSGGLSGLEVNTDATSWFPEGSSIRDSYAEIRNHLSGISPMNVVIDAVDGARVTRPEAVARIDRFTRYLEGLPQVGKAISLADPLREIHAEIAGRRDTALPDESGVIEQYLLLLSGLDYMNDVVSGDRKSANVLLRVNDNRSGELRTVARKAIEWWDKNGVVGLQARPTGIMYEFARSEDEIAWGQIRGLSIAFLVIALLLLLIFRSPMVASMAVVPNVVPLVIVFGFMGMAGISLDAVTVGVGCTALGIAVDDTIHVISGYQHERLLGCCDTDALGRTFDRVLPALVLSTAVIAAGFAVLASSSFTVTRHLGIVTAGVVILCLLADLTLLPSLLIGVGSRWSREE